MASLALVASLVFLFILLIGPITFILAKFKWFPKWMLFILASICFFSGIWFVLLPISVARFVGLIPIVVGIDTYKKCFSQPS